METMYDRIKRMTEDEMKKFIYWVYLNGVADEVDNLRDTYGDCSYFGGAMLNMDAIDVMSKVYELYE